jgi:hypothetical protein
VSVVQQYNRQVTHITHKQSTNGVQKHNNKWHYYSWHIHNIYSYNKYNKNHNKYNNKNLRNHQFSLDFTSLHFTQVGKIQLPRRVSNPRDLPACRVVPQEVRYRVPPYLMQHYLRPTYKLTLSKISLRVAVISDAGGWVFVRKSLLFVMKMCGIGIRSRSLQARSIVPQTTEFRR